MLDAKLFQNHFFVEHIPKALAIVKELSRRRLALAEIKDASAKEYERFLINAKSLAENGLIIKLIFANPASYKSSEFHQNLPFYGDMVKLINRGYAALQIGNYIIEVPDDGVIIPRIMDARKVVMYVNLENSQGGIQTTWGIDSLEKICEVIVEWNKTQPKPLSYLEKEKILSEIDDPEKRAEKAKELKSRNDHAFILIDKILKIIGATLPFSKESLYRQNIDLLLTEELRETLRVLIPGTSILEKIHNHAELKNAYNQGLTNLNKLPEGGDKDEQIKQWKTIIQGCERIFVLRYNCIPDPKTKFDPKQYTISKFIFTETALQSSQATGVITTDENYSPVQMSNPPMAKTNPDNNQGAATGIIWGALEAVDRATVQKLDKSKLSEGPKKSQIADSSYIGLSRSTNWLSSVDGTQGYVAMEGIADKKTATLVDMNSLVLKACYDELKAFMIGSEGIEELLNIVSIFVANQLPLKTGLVRDIKRQLIKTDEITFNVKVQNLDECVSTKTGLSREQSLLTGYLLTQLTKDGYLPTNASIKHYLGVADNLQRHSVLFYQARGQKYLVDPTLPTQKVYEVTSDDQLKKVADLYKKAGFSGALDLFIPGKKLNPLPAEKVEEITQASQVVESVNEKALLSEIADGLYKEQKGAHDLFEEAQNWGFICPITNDLYSDPVIIELNNGEHATYDRQGITTWVGAEKLKGHIPCDPMSRIPIINTPKDSKDYAQNRELLSGMKMYYSTEEVLSETSEAALAREDANNRLNQVHNEKVLKRYEAMNEKALLEHSISHLGLFNNRSLVYNNIPNDSNLNRGQLDNYRSTFNNHPTTTYRSRFNIFPELANNYSNSNNNESEPVNDSDDAIFYVL